jgi:hypothetical protein
MDMGSVYVIIGLAVFVFLLLKYTGGSGFGGLIKGSIPVSNVISHWSHFFKFFTQSSNDFYNALNDVLKEHDMPNTVMGKIKHKEAGLLSASREYFRIKHGDIVFDVCAAPFGKDFFISWWLYETQGTMRTLFKRTKIGDFLTARAEKRTFYQIDEEDMFRSCVHECILETIEKVTASKTELQLSKEDKQFKMGAA